MELKHVRRHWNALARSNAFWSNISTKTTWDAGAFFATGEAEIDATLRRADHLGVLPRRRERALDFGCGVGRLTQAMSRRFARVDGVDIAKAMLREARRHDRSGGRCHYHLNTARHLRRFPDGSFDVVYSNLVLQHMEPSDALLYIAELVRVVAPGGLLVFQLPRRVPEHPDEAIPLPPGGSARAVSSRYPTRLARPGSYPTRGASGPPPTRRSRSARGSRTPAA